MFVSANNAYNAEYREIIGAKLPESDFICLGGKYLVFSPTLNPFYCSYFHYNDPALFKCNLLSLDSQF